MDDELNEEMSDETDEIEEVCMQRFRCCNLSKRLWSSGEAFLHLITSSRCSPKSMSLLCDTAHEIDSV